MDSAPHQNPEALGPVSEEVQGLVPAEGLGVSPNSLIIPPRSKIRLRRSGGQRGLTASMKAVLVGFASLYPPYPLQRIPVHGADPLDSRFRGNDIREP
jgi:hypothetical protein